MSSKDTILEALKTNSPTPLERGPLGFTPMTFEDPLSEFRERVVKAAAARCFLAEEAPAADAGEPAHTVDTTANVSSDISACESADTRDSVTDGDTEGSTPVDRIIRKVYPDAKRIASNLPEVTCATINPDELEDPRELAGTDVAVVRGAFGVAENGAVWIPRAFRHKAMLFVPEALVILLDRRNIVSNMHEAYTAENFDSYDFGSFIAGPSKTADIEQALVIGAHGPRDVTVILL